MKKFVGNVNGKTFDNEKEFAKAAAAAVKGESENLSISSYYEYSEDCDDCLNSCKKSEQVNEKETKEVEQDNEQDNKQEDKGYTLNESEYSLKPDALPDVNFGVFNFPLSDSLKTKISIADNKDEIRENMNTAKDAIEKEIKKLTLETSEIEKKIEFCQNELYTKELEIKNLTARKRYCDKVIGATEEKGLTVDTLDLEKVLRELRRHFWF